MAGKPRARAKAIEAAAIEAATNAVATQYDATRGTTGRTPDEADMHAVFAALANGATTHAACRELGLSEGMTRLAFADERWAPIYARARERQTHAMTEAIVDIADTDRDASRARNRIDARKWLASKVMPAVYGDRIAVDASVTVVPVLTRWAPEARQIDADAELAPGLPPPPSQRGD